MNKDKIIKDLKKRNDSLKMQYEYRNIRCIHLEYENQRLQQENQQLKKQKDEVVEYVKKHFQDDEGIICKYVGDNACEINENFIDELLRMLGEIDG